MNACNNEVDGEIDHSNRMFFFFFFFFFFFLFFEDLPSSGHEAKLEDSMDEANTQNSRASTPLHPNMDLNTLASFLNSEDEWTS